MKALVLGGTQFISQAVAQALVARGHETSILTRGRRPVVFAGLARQYRADRRDAESMRCLHGARFDAVFDCSGYDARDVGTVLDVLCPDERASYVFLSSGAVYLPSSRPTAEDAPTGRSEVWGAYGQDKLAAEGLLASAQARAGFQLSLVRPAYVYGPGNNLYRESFLFDRLERGAVVPVPASEARTQFAFIDDVVRLLLGMPGAHTGVEAFNCAHPEAVGWERLVRAAAAAVGIEARIKRVPYEGVLEPRSFFPFRDCTYLLDTAKAERFALDRPSTCLEEGLRRAYAWHRLRGSAVPDPKMTKVEAALAL